MYSISQSYRLGNFSMTRFQGTYCTAPRHSSPSSMELYRWLPKSLALSLDYRSEYSEGRLLCQKEPCKSKGHKKKSTLPWQDNTQIKMLSQVCRMIIGSKIEWLFFPAIRANLKGTTQYIRVNACCGDFVPIASYAFSCFCCCSVLATEAAKLRRWCWCWCCGWFSRRFTLSRSWF